MTERHGELTRYLTFKLDKYAMYLRSPAPLVIKELQTELEGLTFEELMERTGIGPQHLRAVLGILFGQDYIITNHQMAKLQEKHGIDAQKLRRFEP